MQANQNFYKDIFIPDYDQSSINNTFQIPPQNSIITFPIQNHFFDSSFSRKDQSFFQEDDFGGSYFIQQFLSHSEVKNNDIPLEEEDYRKKVEEYKKKEDEDEKDCQKKEEEYKKKVDEEDYQKKEEELKDQLFFQENDFGSSYFIQHFLSYFEVEDLEEEYKKKEEEYKKKEEEYKKKVEEYKKKEDEEDYRKKEDEEDYRKKEEEYKKKEEGYKKIIEEYKKKEEEAKNEKEDLSQKNQSQIYNKDYFHHPNKDHPEKNPFYYSKISLDKEFPSFSEKKNEFGEQISGDCNNFFKKDNIHQDDNQKLNKKETKIFFDAKKISKEKAEEKNFKNFSRIEDKKGNKIYIPNIENKSSLNKKNSNIFIHEDNEVEIDIPQQIINSNIINENHNISGFQNNREIKIDFNEKSIPNNKNFNIFINDDSDFKIDIPQQIINSNQTKENYNISGFHNNSEIKINFKEKSINSKQNQINNDSMLNGSTGDTSQKNNLNISGINKYKFPFKVIFVPDELVTLNKSSENLYVNFKRKRKRVRKEVNNHEHMKKAEDLEKSILRKFKAYIRFKKKNEIKEFKNIIDKDLNFWGSFLQNNKPFTFIQKGGKKKIFNSYGKSLMDFIFSRDDVDDLYKRFASDKSYLNQLLESFNKKSEGYKQAYLIALKNLNKKYNNKYNEEDLELKYDEDS